MEAIKKANLSEIDEKIDKIDGLFHELTRSKLTIMGKEFDLGEWKTLSDYSKKYNYSVARVQTWISRGVVPGDCVIVVPELNYMKLIKDRPYETRATK